MKEEVKKIYENMSVNKWGHVTRVMFYADQLCDHLEIGEEYKKLVMISALLHDIGYKKQFELEAQGETEDKHEMYSVELVKEILEKEGYSNNEIKIIQETISTHGVFEDCKTPFQMILYDADKLEKTGMGEVIRKSIILHEKYKMNDIEIFERLNKKMKERKFHFHYSKKLAEMNISTLRLAFEYYESQLLLSEKILENLYV